MQGALDRKRWVIEALSFALLLVFAWRSFSYFHPDEHWQIIEFASIKAGTTPWAEAGFEAMPIRPWLQPGLYYVVFRATSALGLDDPFRQAFVCRLLTGIAYFLALRFLVREYAEGLGDRKRDAWIAGLWIRFAGFFYYLAVRTSSETATACGLMIAVALTFRAERKPGWALWLGIGLASGFAFETRFQSAFALVGLAAWLALNRRLDGRRIALGLLGFLLVVGLGTFVDHWGYGIWVCAPYNYYVLNIVRGLAESYGTKPWFAYFYLLPPNYFSLVSLVALVAMLFAWVRRPRSLTTFVTLPFFVAHCLLRHKEERFLFPLVPFSALFLVEGFLLPSQTRFPLADKLASALRTFATGRFRYALFVANGIGLLQTGLWPSNREDTLPSGRVLLATANPGAWVLQDRKPGLPEPQPFYNRHRVKVVGTLDELCRGPNVERWLWTKEILSPGDPLQAELGLELVYNDFPTIGGIPALQSVAAFRRKYHAFPLSLPSVSWFSLYRVHGDPCAAKAFPQDKPLDLRQ